MQGSIFISLIAALAFSVSACADNRDNRQNEETESPHALKQEST